MGCGGISGRGAAEVKAWGEKEHSGLGEEGGQRLLRHEAAEGGKGLSMEGHPKKSHFHRFLMT